MRVLAAGPRAQPVVTYSILGLTIFMYLLQVLSQSILGYDLPAFYGSKVNQLIENGQYWRLLTPVLLHGSLLHIGFNMYALWILGPGLERFYGRGRFLTLYLVSGFGGNVFSFIFTPNPSLGSSTAIFGLFAAQGMFFYQNRAILGSVSRQALMNVIFLAVANFVIGLSPGIDNWGHLGGFLAGGMFAFAAGPILGVSDNATGYQVYDRRNPNAAWIAGLIISGFYAFLVVMTIFMR
jgi:rhomboid protease GluP